MNQQKEITSIIAYYFDMADIPKKERVQLYLPLKEFLTFSKMRKLAPTLETMNLFFKTHSYRKHWKNILEKYLEFIIND